MAEPAASESNYDELICRALTYADLEIRGDGRSVYGVIVPFDRETVVNGREGKFREVFRSGAFRQSINVGVSRVKLFVNHNHLRGKEPIGVATSLAEEPKQLVGEFRIANTTDGEEALQKIRDGVFDAFSIGFADVPGKSIRSKDLIERTEVKLREVSVVSYPAYEDAAIAGIRAAFPELTGEVLERLLALATNLDTRTMEAADGTSEDEQSRSDEQDDHSSTEPDVVITAPEPPLVDIPPDRSFAARQRQRREIEMFRVNVRKND
jgi:hypothetical protein